MHPRPHLLSRLVIDVVLPSMIAALALVLALCMQQTHNLGERADAAIAVRMERLAGELGRGATSSPQGALDRALSDGRADQLLRVEFHRAGGGLWSSGSVPSQGSATYRSELGGEGDNTSWLSMQVATYPLRRAQGLVWLLGGLCAAGILMLAWLARVTLRHRVLQPLAQVQDALHELINARHP